MNEQRSPEWFAERSGKFTGSKFINLMKRSKSTGKPLKGWDDCVWDVVAERLTGTYKDGISAAALRWGNDVEPYASDAYEVATGNIVTETGLIVHPQYNFAAASPDGLIDGDGGLEMKCPQNSTIHLARLLDGMEEDHQAQVQGGMWCTGRDWWDFFSYDPRMPEKQREFIFRVERDDAYISKLEESVLEAEFEACRRMTKIIERTEGKGVTP